MAENTENNDVQEEDEYVYFAIADVRNYVNVRKGPNTDSDIVGKIYSGAVAQIINTVGEGEELSGGISKYVTGAIDPPSSKEELDLAITQWLGGSSSIHDAYKRLNEMISGGEQNGES